jgi:hypothetical protein
MNLKITALIVSLLAVGASASLHAAAACCPTSAPAAGQTTAAAPAASPNRLLLTSYERISNALANDDLRTAHQEARTFRTVCQMVCDKNGGDQAKECKPHLQAFLDEKEIDKAREHFKKISAEVIKLAQKEEGYLVMTCPMAGENADWVQSSREVRNPYHGSRMLRCGSVKAEQQASVEG